MKQSYLLSAVLFLTLSCSPRVEVKVSETKTVTTSSAKNVAKNVIFLIGDGMGTTQITAGMLANDNTLHLERCPIVGLSKTAAAGSVITDSAAGATAFSIGKKTYNGAIGIDADGVSHSTILEDLGRSGYATGLISTSNITHATPASFYAHQEKRSMYYSIAADMVDSPVNVFVGGGRIHFVDRTNPDRGAVDDRNIEKELVDKGFTFVNSLDALSAEEGNVGYFISEDHPKSIIDGRSDILPRSIKPVATKLDAMSDKGFFMVVEGSQIDWGGHANEHDYIVTEMIDFDKAVGQAIDFAEADGNTLVLITADHETGGYGLQSVDRDYSKMEGAFTTGGHTATMVPVFAYGPGSEHFSGTYENTDIYHRLIKALDR